MDIFQPILSVNKLSLTSSKGILFKDISFELFQGEVLAIMGPSGIGKSMLSKAIAGFLPSNIITQGSIELNGNDISQLSMLHRAKHQRPGVIFQDALRALNPLASIEKHLCLALTGNKIHLNKVNKDIIVSLLERLRFTDAETILSKYPNQLSGGQRQRICIAIALLSKANLIIADEPTSGLDPSTESEILELLYTRVQQSNNAALLITHDLSMALKCDKILIISDSKVVAYGSPSKAIQNSQHPFCQKLLKLLDNSRVLEKFTKVNCFEIIFKQVSVHYYSKPKWFGGKPSIALEQLDLSIKEQDLAIVGPSGAGKSTFIELLFGLRRPSSGEIYVCGYKLSKNSSKQSLKMSKHIQLIPQEPQSSLNPFYTVRQVLHEPLNNIGIFHNQNERVEQVINQVGLDKSFLEYNSYQLSVGQAQRVAIARALIVNPNILVADEPTSSLDPVNRQQIIDLLISVKKIHRMSLILVTHDLYAAQALCDRILVLDHGKVVEYNTSQNVVNNPKHLITKSLLNT
ncbi:ABC transporter ATP-binding protein [Francisella hispaniensis]|uniref:ABC transporter ATP-binding protein n=1 Tax=Francisella hispaniensis TaxID=622488 RepID=UPI000A7A7988|nr:ATP-binding cassette domain-containing protein [Francisella hispaniensis]